MVQERYRIIEKLKRKKDHLLPMGIMGSMGIMGIMGSMGKSKCSHNSH